MAGLNQLLPRKAGSGSILHGAKALSATGGDNLVDFPRIPTGVFPFDYASGGGVPCNVPTQFFGVFQGGKSTLSYLAAKSLATFCMRCMQPVAMCACKAPNFTQVCGTCKKPPGDCTHKGEPIEVCADCGQPRLACTCGSRLIQKTFLCHTEGMPPDDLYFDTLGYDTADSLIIGVPEYGEQACEMIEAAIQADDCGLVIVDSLAGLLPRAEMESAYEDVQVGAQARLVAKLFRRISPILVKEFRRGHMVGLVFINQVRSVIGAGKWEPTEKTPGGWAAKHGYRLSVRVNQLSVDEKKGEKDKEDGMKNVGRFSVSLISAESKQQMLVLAGKAEYKITFREWEGFAPGACLDAQTCIAIGRDVGVLEKTPKGYDLKGTNMSFRVLSDIDELFRTGQYVHQASGEVTFGAADVFRHVVLQKAKADAVADIRRRAEIRVNMLQSPLQV